MIPEINTWLTQTEHWMIIYPIFGGLTGFLIAKIQNKNDEIKKLRKRLQ